MRANTASFEGRSPDPDRALALAREAMEAWLEQHPRRMLSEPVVTKGGEGVVIRAEWKEE